MKPSFAIASNFQCKGSWMDRLLVAEGERWRAPHEDELDSLTLNKPPEDAAACFCLFASSLAGGWEGSEEVVRAIEAAPRRGKRRVAGLEWSVAYLFDNDARSSRSQTK